MVYVDDVIITGNNDSLIDKFVSMLDTTFALKDLGILHYFLGLQVHYLPSGILLNQEKYVTDLLSKLNWTGLKPTVSPCAVGRRLSINEGVPLADSFLYRSTIGALQYLTHTRPDIAFIVNHLSQFLQRPYGYSLVRGKTCYAVSQWYQNSWYSSAAEF